MAFQAGSIFVDIQASAADFSAEIEKAIARLGDLALGIGSVGAAATEAGAQISAGLFRPIQQISDSVTELAVQDKLAVEQFQALVQSSGQAGAALNGVTAATQRFSVAADNVGRGGIGIARGLARIGSAATRVGALVSLFAATSSDAFGRLGRAGTALQGVLGAISTAFLFKFGPIGIAITVIASLAAAIISLRGPTEEETKALEDLNKQIDTLAGSANESAKAVKRVRDEAKAGLNVEVRFGGDALAKGLENVNAIIDETSSQIVKLTIDLDDIQKRLENSRLLPRDQFEKLQVASIGTQQEIRRLKLTIPDLTKTLADLNAQQAQRDTLDKFRETLDGISEQSDILKTRLEAGLIDPLQFATQKAQLAEQSLEAFVATVRELSKTVGEAKAIDLLRGVVFDPARVKAAAVEFKAAADALKQQAEDQKKADEEAKQAAQDRIDSVEDLQVSFGEFLDDVRKESDELRGQVSLTEAQRKVMAEQAKLQEFINSNKIKEQDIEQARRAIAELAFNLQENSVVNLEKEIAGRVRAIGEQEKQSTALEDTIALEKEFLATFAGSEEQLKRVAIAFNELRQAAAGRDTQEATAPIIELNKQLEREIASTTDLSEVDAVRRTILERRSELEKLTANASADQLEVQRATANIEKLRVALNEQLALDAAKQVEQFAKTADLRQQTLTNEEKFLELRDQIAAKFPEGIPISVKLKLDEAQVIAAKNDFNDNFATPFASTFSGALKGAILDGRSAFETLGDFGRGLFENFVNDSSEKLQKGLSDALTNAFGAGGSALGGAFSALFGGLGLLLSKKAGGNAQTSFANVGSSIQNSQALRGVISGPGSVAVASLGNDLGRALIPTNLRLDRIAEILIRMGRGGGAPSSDLRIAGTVPA